MTFSTAGNDCDPEWSQHTEPESFRSEIGRLAGRPFEIRPWMYETLEDIRVRTA